MTARFSLLVFSEARRAERSREPRGERPWRGDTTEEGANGSLYTGTFRALGAHGSSKDRRAPPCAIRRSGTSGENEIGPGGRPGPFNALVRASGRFRLHLTARRALTDPGTPQAMVQRQHIDIRFMAQSQSSRIAEFVKSNL